MRPCGRARGVAGVGVVYQRRDKRGPLSFNPSSSNYCWTHGYKVGKTQTSLTCNTPKPGHKAEATRAYNMGGSQANKE
jgi:hypothetical protein